MDRLNRRCGKTRPQLCLTYVLFLAVCLHGCGKKAPLVESSGFLSIVGAHHSSEENVSYVFFEIHENERILDHALLQYSLKPSVSASRDTQSWKNLDLNTGVHLHSVNPCATNVRCGSFSWHSSESNEVIHLRMLYHPEGTADLKDNATARTLVGPSAMIYGVFDEQNEHTQVRVEDNFGIPSRLDSPNYGMKRRFLIRSPQNAAASKTDMDTLTGQRLDNYLYPATFCTKDETGTAVKDFTGYRSWLPTAFTATNTHNGVCFTADSTDKNGVRLTIHPAFARRNPKFNRGQFRYANPLTDAIKIPLIIAYCSDAVGAGTARDSTFYEYQRSLIGYSEQAEDLCFTISDAGSFRNSFKNLIATKLSAAKAASLTGQDFIFTIVLHQNLTSEFRLVHQVIAEETNALIKTEEPKVSPRLAGAFVYDSRSDFRPTADQETRIIWCPQTRPNDPSKPPTSANENCMVQDIAKINLEFLNFVTSLGPFPSLPDYKDYVSKYGDRGLAKKPDLTFASVPHNGSTFQETSAVRVTYFDSERLVIANDEHVRVCWERDQSYLLNTLMLREDGQAASTPGIPIRTAESKWLMNAGRGSYRLGLSWELPFIGKITFRSSIQGTFISLVPFGRSFNSYQRLGDSRWLLPSMDLGELLQVCNSYCHHPYFDEHGTYQIPVTFDSTYQSGCVTPRYPIFGEDS